MLWVLSAAIGALGLLIFSALGTPGLVLLFAPLLIAWMCSGPRRSLKAVGALAGFGVATLLVFAGAGARCADSAAQPNQSCTAPNLTFAIVATAVVLVVGLALTSRAWPRST
jgi:hypothetical protein